MKGLSHTYTLFFFLPCSAACVTSVPQPGMKPGPTAEIAQSVNHWTTREFPYPFLIGTNSNWMGNTKDNLPRILHPSSVLSSQPSFPPSSFRNSLPTVSPEVQVGLHLLHQNKAGEPDWANQCIMFPWPGHWRRQWQPTPALLPGKSQAWGSLVGCCLWDCTESDTWLKRLSSSSRPGH